MLGLPDERTVVLRAQEPMLKYPLRRKGGNGGHIVSLCIRLSDMQQTQNVDTRYKHKHRQLQGSGGAGWWSFLSEPAASLACACVLPVILLALPLLPSWHATPPTAGA